MFLAEVEKQVFNRPRVRDSRADDLSRLVKQNEGPGVCPVP